MRKDIQKSSGKKNKGRAIHDAKTTFEAKLERTMEYVEKHKK